MRAGMLKNKRDSAISGILKMNLTMSTTAQVVEMSVIVNNGTAITRTIILNLLFKSILKWLLGSNRDSIASRCSENQPKLLHRRHN